MSRKKKLSCLFDFLCIFLYFILSLYIYIYILYIYIYYIYTLYKTIDYFIYVIIINQKSPLNEKSDHPFSLKKSMTLIKHRVFKILILLPKTFRKILVSCIILIGTFGIFQNLNCKSIFVIYMMECILCKIQYINKAKTPINIRLNNHLFITKFHINNFEGISTNNSMKSFNIVFHYVKLIFATIIFYSLY